MRKAMTRIDLLDSRNCSDRQWHNCLQHVISFPVVDLMNAVVVVVVALV